MTLLFQPLPDGGPLYAETNMHSFIAEPFNAISSLAYLIPAIFWMLRVKSSMKDFPFLVSCLPFLVAGGIGSTLYHAFRTSPYLLMMDVLPIAIVTLMVSIYFWIKVLNKWWQVFFILVPFMFSRFFIFRFISSGEIPELQVDRQTAINISYFISGVMIFLPAMILIFRKKFLHSFPLVASCLLFILGLTFRETDSWQIASMPMGTHWLWHVSTAAGCWFLGEYLYLLRRDEVMPG